MNIRVTFSAALLLAVSVLAAQEQEGFAPPPYTGQEITVPIRHWAPGAHDKMAPVMPSVATPRNQPSPFTGYFTMPENPEWQAPWYQGPPSEFRTPDQGSPIDAQPLLQSFHGEGVTNLTPPDPDIASGPNCLITTVNSAYAIWDKCGNRIVEQNISAFLGDTTSFLFDPHTTYDPWVGRWIMQWHARRIRCHSARH